MACCWSIDGHLGTVVIEDCEFQGDPCVYPAFVGDPRPPGGAIDGACILLEDDTGKGAWLDERGYAVTKCIVRGLKYAFNNSKSALMQLSACGEIIYEISPESGLGFDFRTSNPKPTFAFLQNSGRQNGKVTITAAGTTPGALYNYGGGSPTTAFWHPNTLPGQTNEKLRIQFKGEHITLFEGPQWFPNGYTQATFDSLQRGMTFTVLQ